MQDALYRAIHTGTLARVIAIIDGGGVDLNYGHGHGSTALHFACLLGKTDVITELIRRRVDLDPQDEVGSTPLHCIYKTIQNLVLDKEAPQIF
jgi:ankyrin repeat protein